ncbi:Rsd/AlgQ family anti-sigma factor [Neptuniibacter caesariensis]|uniref:Regulator of RpoD, Rsd/AlgQ n=1 Tax=Neptuniibacter caesariensis TaxID=207954 RepID=A0A7U8GS98_NEPCE|nr:Rsd/AlgQ family anti-sigma factor [Neptuniibacter caesariensis]EAR61181.1 Regulator of RpoD, Rsd/AlgQ [Oceanospirillum sp. MED92] [Neptuniibacter caesariensis]
MLEKCKNAKERWGGVSEIIDSWLEERQALISQFVHLPEHHINDELNTKVQSFCQVLMDYLSSGHFEVYEQLLREGSDFDDGSLEEGQSILPKIQISTDVALDFNDDFSNLLDPTVQQIREFSERLSKLGEALEERFELEDQMIAVLHTSHKELVEG